MALSPPVTDKGPQPCDGTDHIVENGITGPSVLSEEPRPPTAAAVGVGIGTWLWGCLHGPCKSHSCVPVGRMPSGPGLLLFLFPHAIHYPFLSSEFIRNLGDGHSRKRTKAFLGKPEKGCLPGPGLGAGAPGLCHPYFRQRLGLIGFNSVYTLVLIICDHYMRS